MFSGNKLFMLIINNVFLPWRANVLYNLVQIGVFLFGALSLAIPSGYSYGPGLLLLASLFVCWRPIYWTRMPKEIKVLAYIFALYFCVQAISIWLDGGAIREFDRPSRVLMAIMILPLLVNHPIHIISLTFGFGVGACAAGLVAVFDKFYIGMDRAFDDVMPIQAGNISMTLGILCLCSYFWFKIHGRLNYAIFMLFSCMMGMLGSFLSGTRGGWILLPLILFTIVMFFKANFCRTNKIAAIIFLVFSVGIILTPQTQVMSRIYSAHDDVVQFFDGGNKDTSVGIRFQLWSSALDAFLKKPLFGWGNNHIRQAQFEQMSSGTITPFIYEFDSHAHNQFLDEMAKRGIIGLVVIVLLFTYPFYLFKKGSKNKLSTIMLGVSSLAIIDYSLTQVFIGHNSGIVFFSMLFSFLAVMNSMNDEVLVYER